MRDRKEMKKRAKQVVRTHYGIFLVVCLVAAYIGSEFGSSLDFVKQTDPDVLIEAEESGEIVSTGMATGVYEITAADAIFHAIIGDVETGKEISKKITEHEVSKAKDGGKHRILGKSRGILAGIANGIKSGSIIVCIISGARNIGMSQNMVIGMSIVIAILLAACMWFFLTNMYQAITRRIFLEARIYEKVPFKRIFIFIRAFQQMVESLAVMLK